MAGKPTENTNRSTTKSLFIPVPHNLVFEKWADRAALGSRFKGMGSALLPVKATSISKFYGTEARGTSSPHTQTHPGLNVLIGEEVE
jgi:hypothetical protein